MIRCLNCMKEFDEQYGVCPHCGYIPGSEPKEPFQLRPGVVLNRRYLVGTAVGVGGFGITYRAWDMTLQQVIALKEYYPSANGIVNRTPGTARIIVYSGARAAEFEKGKLRFLAEARNMARFSTHPNIVHVYDFFEENGTAYFTMEFLDGISYKQFISSNTGRIDWPTAEKITVALLDALQEIHSAGIIHRDISPDNVFITQSGVIKLIDFGAARFSSGEEEKTLSVILKPGYAPPEQYRTRSRQGPWTDIYAVGAMFYRAVTGRMPDESVNRMVKDELPPPHQLIAEIPETISNAVMRAMAVSPELRFQTVGQFREALRSAVPVRSVPEELKHRQKYRIGIIAAVFALLLAAGGMTGHMYLQKQRAVALAPASIELWYPLAEGESQERLPELLEEYRKDYPQIEIHAKAIPDAEYAEQIESAIREGRAPTVFESTGLDSSCAEHFAPVEDAYGFLKKRGWTEDYYFLGNYEQYFPQKQQLPMSFQIPVIYANRLLIPELPEELKTLKEVRELTEAEGGYTLSEAAGWEYRDMDLKKRPVGGYEDFVVYISDEKEAETPEEEERRKREMLKGKAGYYFSDTEEYGRIQEDMPGLYSPLLMKDMKLCGRFSDLWSVSADAAEAEQKAGIRLLYYLLSEKNQQIMNLQGGRGLPLNKKIFGKYCELNVELAGLKDSMKTLEILKDSEE